MPSSYRECAAPLTSGRGRRLPMALLLALAVCAASRTAAATAPAAGAASRRRLAEEDEAEAMAGAEWPHEPPGRPWNITVTSGPDFAVISWTHAPPSAGGHAIQFSLKWQGKDSVEVQYFPEWLGASTTSVRLKELEPGFDYACRVAAVNQLGRTWSDFVTFRTLEPMACPEMWHWTGILDEADVVEVTPCPSPPTQPRPRAPRVRAAHPSRPRAAVRH